MTDHEKRVRKAAKLIREKAVLMTLITGGEYCYKSPPCDTYLDLSIEEIADFIRMHLPETPSTWVSVEERLPDDAANAWNRSTPAPMTSVVQWVRYDGTPDTLPPMNSHVLTIFEGDVEIMWYTSKPTGREWGSMDDERFDLEEGDVLARLPNRPGV